VTFLNCSFIPVPGKPKDSIIHRDGAKVAKEILYSNFNSVKTFAFFAPWRFNGFSFSLH